MLIYCEFQLVLYPAIQAKVLGLGTFMCFCMVLNGRWKTETHSSTVNIIKVTTRAHRDAPQPMNVSFDKMSSSSGLHCDKGGFSWEIQRNKNYFNLLMSPEWHWTSTPSPNLLTPGYQSNIISNHMQIFFWCVFIFGWCKFWFYFISINTKITIPTMFGSCSLTFNL